MGFTGYYRSLPEDFRSEMVKFSKIFLIAAIIFYTAFRLSGIDSEVGTLYFRYAESMVSGNMPYSDFDAEYPPFAMLMILLPRLISWDSFSYQIAFGIVSYVFLLAGLYWTYGIAERYTEHPKRICDLYIIFTIILLDFVLDRYDIFPMVMMIGAMYLFSKEKYPAAWLILAIAAATKLYPALAIPFFIIWHLKRKESRNILVGLGLCVAVAAVCMLPFAIKDMDTMFTFLTYHMDRGLQTEAPISGIFMLLDKLGLTEITYRFDYGSDNIYGSVPDAIAKVMMPLMALCIVALCCYHAYLTFRKGDDNALTVIMFTLAALMAFMLISKVLSSQYLVWIIPFIALLVMACDTERGKRVFYVFVASVILTQLNLIVNYAMRDAGEEFSTIGILILLARNILLFVLSYYIIRQLSNDVPSRGQA